jgi:archaellum component FlaC
MNNQNKVSKHEATTNERLARVEEKIDNMRRDLGSLREMIIDNSDNFVSEKTFKAEITRIEAEINPMKKLMWLVIGLLITTVGGAIIYSILK